MPDSHDIKKQQFLVDYVENELAPTSPDVDLREIINFFRQAESFDEHYTRYLETYIRMKRYVPFDKTWQIGEAGYLSGVSKFLNTQGWNINPFYGDFRYRIEATDDSLDLFICLEVLEHIKDQDAKTFDDLVIFNFTGVDAFVTEMWRIIKPGGMLVLSTPNACSLLNLARLIGYDAPLFFWWHVREFPPTDVIRRFTERGFQLRHWETMFALFFLGNEERQRLLKELFIDRGASADNRGDIAIFIFQKPIL